MLSAGYVVMVADICGKVLVLHGADEPYVK